MILRVNFHALLCWGLWEEVICDHGGQFISHDFQRVNQRLGIRHEMYDRGQPWLNLIESQFEIQARLGEYHWERCRSVEAVVEFHRDLIRDQNRLPHWTHQRRNIHTGLLAPYFARLSSLNFRALASNLLVVGDWGGRGMRGLEPKLDWRVLGFTLGLSLLTGILVGLGRLLHSGATGDQGGPARIASNRIEILSHSYLGDKEN